MSHDVYENTWKCGEHTCFFFFYSIRRRINNNKKNKKNRHHSESVFLLRHYAGVAASPEVELGKGARVPTRLEAHQKLSAPLQGCVCFDDVLSIDLTAEFFFRFHSF